MATEIELYGTRSCPFTEELRQELEWQGHAYNEYDVESDPAALERMLALTSGRRSVPVLVEDGKVSRIGFQGRTCMV